MILIPMIEERLRPSVFDFVTSDGKTAGPLKSGGPVLSTNMNKILFESLLHQNVPLNVSHWALKHSVESLH